MKFTRNLWLSALALLAVVFTGSVVAPSAAADDKQPMKCVGNQDRVWVYDSLTTFDVTAKLNCGDSVEIVSRTKGFVKIRAANGVEGYVPEATFPNLPPLEDENSKTVSLAQLRPKPAAHASAPASVSPAAAARPAPTPMPVPTAAAAPAAAPTPAPAATIVAASQPVVNPAAKTTATLTPAHAASAPASVAAPAPSAAPVDIVLSTSPESAPSAHANSAAKSAAAPTKKSTASTSRSSSSASKSASPKSGGSQPPAAGSTSHANPAPAPPPPPANPLPAETTANFQPSRNPASLHAVAATPESEDFPDSEPVSESADPSCQVFFSAYGLVPDQFKWLAENRKHHFSNVCPAPDVNHVDFVVILTHDIDFYGGTLPPPVHTDKNGFSDFSPVMMMDTASMSLSEAEKSHREYVFVFQMKRGSFNPSNFSPRRRFQFAKMESNGITSGHAAGRTLEDAFHYMEGQGPSR